ncbi:MAG: hypothetical protein IPF57_16950 [Gammaproteobacteria bacterium]|nr:hypothetical protein [Gammaproteobacteria bacterium]
MNRTTIDLWVGIFVALGAVALVFLSLGRENDQRHAQLSTYELEASLDIRGEGEAPVKVPA